MASGTLTLNTPAACKSLSVLAASAQGGGAGTMVIHFADGTTSSAINFNARNYATSNFPSAGAAITNFGLLIAGDYNVFNAADVNTVFPTLYQTAVNLHNLGLDANLIASVTFTMPATANTNMATGVFALSGTENTYTGNYLLSVSASPANAGMANGGGQFAAGSTNIVTAAATTGYLSANWSQGGIVVSTSSSYTNILNADVTLVANFQRACNLTVSASPSGGGTVSGSGIFVAGTTNVGGSTAADGFEFIGWTGQATGDKHSFVNHFNHQRQRHGHSLRLAGTMLT